MHVSTAWRIVMRRRLFLLISFLVIAACGGTDPNCQADLVTSAVPPFPPNIFYVSQSGATKEIFRYDKSTNTNTNLSRNPNADDYNPTYNRVTNKVVF